MTEYTELIRSERKTRKLSQWKFANALAVPQAAIAQWEGGARPSTDTLIEIHLKAPESWGRQFAYRLLRLRYPALFPKTRISE